MTKFLLTFLASSASVVVLFVATNFPFFGSHLATSASVNKSALNVKPVNLNIASSNLGLTNSQLHILDANFCCNCSLCIQFS